MLVDTSIWIDHLRVENQQLSRLLRARQVLAHRFVVGEIALRNIQPREQVLIELQDLPQAIVAPDHDVLHFIERNHLFGQGIGYVDTNLLAAVRLTLGATLWTRDRRLSAIADRIGLAFDPGR
jgi:predicted nucleic acid-binding protein